MKTAKCCSLFPILKVICLNTISHRIGVWGGAGGFVRIQRFHRDKACQRQRAEANLFSTRDSHSYSSFLHLVTSPSDFVRAPHLLNSSSKANFNFWAICVLIFLFLMIALAIVFDYYGGSTTMVVALVSVISCYCH